LREVGFRVRKATMRLTLSTLLLVAACGGASPSPTPSPAPGSGADTAEERVRFRTLVILGDSISDRGGQAPYYYDLLVRNDDAKWPEDKGLDLETLLDPRPVVVKRSQSGARVRDLAGQLAAIPPVLEGPVAVVMTIGGNDVRGALVSILTGGSDASARGFFATDLGDAVDELTTEGRFGPGVEVSVFMTNVYDPSDGTGSFVYLPTNRSCPGLGLFPAGRPTAPILDPWEAIFEDVAASHPRTRLLDLRALFNGHGVGAAETWFVSDCIHPNAVGHDAVRDLFREAILP
jgi:lysophospholipase L1-like esterase